MDAIISGLLEYVHEWQFEDAGREINWGKPK